MGNISRTFARFGSLVSPLVALSPLLACSSLLLACDGDEDKSGDTTVADPSAGAGGQATAGQSSAGTNAGGAQTNTAGTDSAGGGQTSGNAGQTNAGQTNTATSGQPNTAAGAGNTSAGTGNMSAGANSAGAGNNGGAAGADASGDAGADAGDAGADAGDGGADAGDGGADAGDGGADAGDGGADAGEGGAATGEPDTDPPADAYVACSGADLPGLVLTPVFDDLELPIHAEVPVNDPNSMYIALREGTLVRARLDAPGEAPETIVTIDVDPGGECGLLSFALHPNFGDGTENRFYVSFNPECASFGGGGSGSSTIQEYTLVDGTATAQATLVQLDQPEFNHNGGLIRFGPDGYLYVGFGDGGGSNDGHGDNGNGQNTSNIFGSMLRIDVDNIDTPPAGNLTQAEAGGADVDPRILHWGLRNPWRFSFDRDTGDLYIGDVGQNAWEEIDVAPAGSGPLNFGWASREGFVACPGCGGKDVTSGTTVEEPIFVYPQQSSSSVTGGFVYRGSNIPGLYGRYIFGDYVTGDLYSITWDPNSAEQARSCDAEVDFDVDVRLGGDNIVSFVEDADGELYLIGLSEGVIWRFDQE